MHVENVTVYSIKCGETELPRMRLTVEGYEFIFGLKSTGWPDCIASEKCHGKIKQRAYAIAAERLKSFRKGALKIPRVVALENGGNGFHGKVPFGKSSYKFHAFWFGEQRICVELERHTEIWFALNVAQNMWEYAGSRGYGGDQKPPKNSWRIAAKIVNAMIAEKVSGQLRLI